MVEEFDVEVGFEVAEKDGVRVRGVEGLELCPGGVFDEEEPCADLGIWAIVEIVGEVEDIALGGAFEEPHVVVIVGVACPAH